MVNFNKKLTSSHLNITFFNACEKTLCKKIFEFNKAKEYS